MDFLGILHILNHAEGGALGLVLLLLLVSPDWLGLVAVFAGFIGNVIVERVACI